MAFQHAGERAVERAEVGSGPEVAYAGAFADSEVGEVHGKILEKVYQKAKGKLLSL